MKTNNTNSVNNERKLELLPEQDITRVIITRANKWTNQSPVYVIEFKSDTRKVSTRYIWANKRYQAPSLMGGYNFEVDRDLLFNKCFEMGLQKNKDIEKDPGAGELVLWSSHVSENKKRIYESFGKGKKQPFKRDDSGALNMMKGLGNQSNSSDNTTEQKVVVNNNQEQANNKVVTNHQQPVTENKVVVNKPVAENKKVELYNKFVVAKNYNKTVDSNNSKPEVETKPETKPETKVETKPETKVEKKEEVKTNTNKQLGGNVEMQQINLEQIITERVEAKLESVRDQIVAKYDDEITREVIAELTEELRDEVRAEVEAEIAEIKEKARLKKIAEIKAERKAEKKAQLMPIIREQLKEQMKAELLGISVVKQETVVEEEVVEEVQEEVTVENNKEVVKETVVVEEVVVENNDKKKIQVKDEEVLRVNDYYNDEVVVDDEEYEDEYEDEYDFEDTQNEIVVEEKITFKKKETDDASENGAIPMFGNPFAGGFGNDDNFDFSDEDEE